MINEEELDRQILEYERQLIQRKRQLVEEVELIRLIEEVELIREREQELIQARKRQLIAREQELATQLFELHQMTKWLIDIMEIATHLYGILSEAQENLKLNIPDFHAIHKRHHEIHAIHESLSKMIDKELQRHYHV